MQAHRPGHDVAGGILLAIVGSLDWVQNHGLTVLTFASLGTAILYHATLAVCEIVRTRHQINQPPVKPWRGPTYDQLEARN